MSAPDADELARKALELWQDQLAALAGDPEAGAAMARLVGLAALGPAAAMRAFAEAMGGLAAPNGAGEQNRGNAPAAAGAPPAAVASRPGDDRLSSLERRLDQIERRLAALERDPGGPRPL